MFRYPQNGPNISYRPVVTTDTGHTRTGFDASVLREQQALLDFAYEAVGRVAGLAKQIVAQNYSKAADHLYFAGCSSTGGRESRLMTERYPTYFDGVVVGKPVMRTTFAGFGDEWVAVALNQVAPNDENDRPVTRRALSDVQKKAVIDGILNQCDATDGVKDGMIFNPQCRFDPKKLICQSQGPTIDDTSGVLWVNEDPFILGPSAPPVRLRMPPDDPRRTQRPSTPHGFDLLRGILLTQRG